MKNNEKIVMVCFLLITLLMQEGCGTVRGLIKMFLQPEKKFKELPDNIGINPGKSSCYYDLLVH